MTMLGLSQGFPAARLACCHFLFLKTDTIESVLVTSRDILRQQNLHCQSSENDSYNNPPLIASSDDLCYIWCAPSLDPTVETPKHSWPGAVGALKRRPIMLTAASQVVSNRLRHILNERSAYHIGSAGQ